MTVPTAQSDLPDPRDEGDTGTASTTNISDAYTKFQTLTAEQPNTEVLSNDDVLVLFRLSRGTSGNDYEDDLAGWTANASNLTDEQQAFLADHTSLQCRREIASRTTTPPIVLEGMTGDDWYLRELVAGNPSASPEVLEMLSEYEDEDEDTPEIANIVSAVARNPTTPARALARLATDQVKWIRAGVAENPSTPVEALERMADDDWGDRNISSALANNHSTPSSLLARLASHEDDWVKEYVARNPNTPAEVLDRLARSGSTGVGFEVVRNPKTSIDTLTYLASNTSEELGHRSSKELESRLAARAKHATTDSQTDQGR